MENASYIESNNDDSSLTTNKESITESDLKNHEEHTPQLFSDENETLNELEDDETKDLHEEKLFDQDSNEEEDFEIPAFLRKQKF